MRTPCELAHLSADIINSRDAGRFADLVVEDHVNHSPAVGKGRAAVTGFTAHRSDTMPDLALTVEDVLDDGDKDCGRFTYIGTHSGDSIGIPASGASVTMRSIDIRRVPDGVFVEHRDELNLLEVFEQIDRVTMNSAVWTGSARP